MKSLSVAVGVILIGLAIFGYTEVWGADWRRISKGENSLEYYDAEGITRSSKNIVKVSLKSVYTEEGKIDAVRKLGKRFEKVSYEIHSLEIDCSNKKIRFLSSNYYSQDDKVITSHKRTTKWDLIAPESIGEVLFKNVCK